MHSDFSPIRWKNNCLELLDQRLLPDKEVWWTHEYPEAAAKAISDMMVRGAPAIGITAAYGVALACMQLAKSTNPDWRGKFNKDF